ncbi:MAG: hypothetical protein HC895_16115 [Leptolyngbyaceae cyanobacterium SM1_3_5]|nr:hypothetical protein [Leptolyngbyaceae cyanobacterium SM1_3_5]
MPQLPLFGEDPQVEPTAAAQHLAIARAVSHSKPRPQQRTAQSRNDKRSTRPPSKPTCQISLTDSIAPIARSPQRLIEPPPDPPAPVESIALKKPPAESIAITPLPAKKLPAGWVSPDDPAFNYLKNCRLCGWLIKHGGLDHSLCSGDCGWVIDLQWEAWNAQRRKRKEPEPQSATHTTEANGNETLDLFTVGLEGGEA